MDQTDNTDPHDTRNGREPREAREPRPREPRHGDRDQPRGGNKILIDASHPEETRVVVMRNGRVEEFDFESASKKPLRGNIYLAKVTRVEPSLQAAFVEYGGNRHGFLPFNEIHPDYYQIPLADRQALLEEEMADLDDEEDDEPRGRNDREAGHRSALGEEDAPSEAQPATELVPESDPSRIVDEPAPPAQAAAYMPDEATLAEPAPPADDQPSTPVDHIEEIPANTEEPEIITGAGAETDGGDAIEEVAERPRRQRRRYYKIQEVIKRRQILLVQVVKEERGTKGAALTTYLSLAGRYTVLMPNTGSGGGISRKITQPQDRKRLKDIARDLDVPEGMGLIIRTAGASRSTQEIRRDYEYELRLWESIREVTLSSTAPSLVYEEGDLIKRSIRDLYGKDMDEIVVAGAEAHREAQEFMKMLMPSHVKNVVLHQGAQPLFARYPAVDRQLNALFSPHVPLKSGGYLVINQTEALVAIDINSGKSTREFSIEDTATATNLEAADEIARQLRLRDLAGLIVIDFIDMEEKRNIRNVERRLKDALRHDRARIQVGRISHFGLLEMSRQRMRTGVLEGSTSKCPHCEGTGIVRSVESVALAVLRGLEDHLMRDQRTSVVAQTSADVALYILNHKRAYVMDLEQRYGVAVLVQANDKLHGATFQIERSAVPAPPRRQPQRAPVNMNSGFDAATAEDMIEDESPDAAPMEDDDQPSMDEGAPPPRQAEERPGDREGRRRRRRRGRRGRDGDRYEDKPNGAVMARPADDDGGQPDTGDAEPGTIDPIPSTDIASGDDDDQPELVNGDGIEARSPGENGEGGRRRRRGRRGGRRGREERGDVAVMAEPVAPGETVDASEFAGEADPPRPRVTVPEPPPLEPVSLAPITASPAADTAAQPQMSEPGPEPVAPPKPEPLTEPLVTSTAPARPARSGWWRTRGLS
jgi:ribonuclease E